MIEKTIHYIWLGNNELPNSAIKCIDSWKKNMPQYEIKKWSIEDFDFNILPNFVRQAIEKKKWAFACDYLRAYVLYKEGGIYLDSDVFMIKDIEPYLNHSFVSSMEYYENLFDEQERKHVDKDGNADKDMIKGMALNAAMMASVKGHPFLKDVMNYYENTNFINDNGELNSEMLAPHVYALIARKYGFKYINKSQLLLEDIYIYPGDVFAQAFNGITPNSVLVHMCLGSWRDGVTNFYKKQLDNQIDYLTNSDFSRPYLSIVVLCYKVEKYLPQCLESIRRQTFKDFEVIVVDDGSPDGCGAIADAYKAMDPRFKVIHKENGGIIAARKDALNMARGYFAGAVDGDDWISLDMYQKMYEAQTAFDVDIVQTRYLFHYKDHSENIFPKDLPYINYFDENLYKRNLVEDGFLDRHIIEVSLCRSIVRTDKLCKIMNKLDDKCGLCEDAVCMHVYAADAKTLCIINEELYHYRMRSNSCTTTIESRDVNNLYKLFDIAKKELENKELGPYLTKQLAKYFIYHCLTTFVMNVYKSENKAKDIKTYLDDNRFGNLVSYLTKQEVYKHFGELKSKIIYKENGYEKLLENSIIPAFSENVF